MKYSTFDLVKRQGKYEICSRHQRWCLWFLKPTSSAYDYRTRTKRTLGRSMKGIHTIIISENPKLENFKN